MTTTQYEEIAPRELRPEVYELHGISRASVEAHYKLYQGYVDNTNKLNEALAALTDLKTPTGGELRRRLGFEYDGMRLHELYFDNLGGKDTLDANSDLMRKIRPESAKKGY